MSAGRVRERWGELIDRESEVAALVSTGCTNSEIGQKLGSGPLTVKSHVQCMLGKVGARNRAHLVGLLSRELADVDGAR